MAFDACFLAGIVHELREKLVGARVEKVQQPEKDEILLQMHRGREDYRLSISAGANSPRVNLTTIIKENPKAAPMFCMLLRKHLTGSKVSDIRQLGFERAMEMEFEAYDELGFASKKYLIAEIMGKYSNLIFCDKDRKILSAIKIVDFTTSQKRQILPGMIYELPPAQNKENPLTAQREQFLTLYRERNGDAAPEKFIMGNYFGIAALTAREIANGIAPQDAESLWTSFERVMQGIREGNFHPTMVLDAAGKPFEFSFMPIHQYGNSAETRAYPDFGTLIDAYFGTREKAERMQQRANDIFHLLTNAENRLTKKLALQEADLAACAEKEHFKLCGDVITANIYRLKRGAVSATLPNYYVDPAEDMEVALDSRLTPAQNAQRYYKKYNKAKAAERELTHQIALGRAELQYIHTVFDALTKAETENDLQEIRMELYQSGYASRMKNYNANFSAAIKKMQHKPLEFVTDGGYRLLCGKNNTQNDYVTTKLAAKGDWWFHVKNAAGSHVVMVSDGVEPSERDFTQAAMVAAYYSSQRDGQNVAVDYTYAKNVKKPAGAKPGYVIYHTNWTAYVTPNASEVERIKKK